VREAVGKKKRNRLRPLRMWHQRGLVHDSLEGAESPVAFDKFDYEGCDAFIQGVVREVNKRLVFKKLFAPKGKRGEPVVVNLQRRESLNPVRKTRDLIVRQVQMLFPSEKPGDFLRQGGDFVVVDGNLIQVVELLQNIRKRREMVVGEVKKGEIDQLREPAGKKGNMVCGD